MEQNQKSSVTPKMVVFTAPSGAGKTTLVRNLLESRPYFDFSISATTRAKRMYEQDGKDYYFLDVAEFKAKIDQNAFVEWVEVYENQYYGTLRSEIDRIWSTGKHILFDIDVEGALSLKSHFGDKCLTVFVRPPSIEILIQRLISRNTENEASLKKRIDRVTREMTFETNFDGIIVNDDLEIAKVESIHLVENFLKYV